jgi:hypothetical protein
MLKKKKNKNKCLFPQKSQENQDVSISRNSVTMVLQLTEQETVLVHLADKLF